ncbi:Elongator complex protein 2 [Podospora aff. communis PSN243]|uniref:Elongator complex protein 2 n=1 Tax=Podospora aff. communis PSN243 TaxID=3040156 RepID=A0AAV9GZU1_9PEZI|nr:Elongator complex protein 2 [Podospora aff. communis PSN243]
MLSPVSCCFAPGHEPTQKMTEAKVDTRYLSAGANRYAAASDWCENGLVAFGADCNVCLWDPRDSNGITRILSGHTAHVRAVKFLPKFSDEKTTYIVTGGDDHGLRIWALDTETGDASCIHTLGAHTAPINCIATLKGQAAGADVGKRFFVTGAADATVKVWSLSSGGEAKLVQTIKTTKGYFPLALALNPLGNAGKSVIMAVAGTTSNIQIFTAVLEDTGLEFTLQATLTGHENWVRSLDFVREKADTPGSDLLLASASQDKYIRLWRIHQGTALSALGSVGVDMAATALMPGNKIHKLNAGGEKHCVMFEALLLGHEDWIYSARWSRAAGDARLQLLSASADNSLSIWESDAESGIWITVARLGEVSREKGATTATGSIGGFWTGHWSPDGSAVITLGRTGSWRLWAYDAVEDRWGQNIAVSGHTRPVTGISWSRNGGYLLSTSSDQTTRLHAEWAAGDGTWHEMSRPQIHGYDLNCIDSLGPSSFVSGADEKLMRVFTEPKAVAHMLHRLTGSSLPLPPSSLPDAANMPVLGLSNKAIDVIDDSRPSEDPSSAPSDNHLTDRDALDPASMVHKSALEIDHPPFEESLSRHTLWPEVEKLYGHGYELSCLAANHAGTLIASACRASSLNHAVIRLFETAPKWTELRPPLAAHTLTVTRLRFSPDDKYILSVGRDRQWAVFIRDTDSGAEDQEKGYTLRQSNAKGHTRMILDAAWAPRGEVFATAGRDKMVKIWVGGKDGFGLGLGVAMDHAATALDFAEGVKEDGTMFLAVGTEAGRLLVLEVRVREDGVVQEVERAVLREELWLPRAVMQLAWRPAREGSKARELAVAGEDGSLRIYGISLQ